MDVNFEEITASIRAIKPRSEILLEEVASVSFGTLENLDEDSELEVRASWTPTSGKNIADHIRAWVELLEMSAGLAPIPDGVTQLSRSR